MDQNYSQFLYSSARAIDVAASGIDVQSLKVFKTKVYQQPKIVNEKIFVPFSDASIRCYDLSSKQELWVNSTFSSGLIPKFINSDMELVIHNNKVYVQLKGKMFELDGNTGLLIKTIEPFTDDLKATCFFEDFIYFTDLIDNKVFAKAVSLSTSETLWSYEIEIAMASVVSKGDIIIITNGTKELIALNKITGAELWTYDLKNLDQYDTGEITLASYPMIIKDRLIGSAGNGTVFSIDLISGELIWKTKIRGNLMPDNISFDGKGMLYVSGMHEVNGLDINTGDIKVKTGEVLSDIFERRMFFTGPVIDDLLIITSRTIQKLVTWNLLTDKLENSISLNGSCKYVPFAAQNKLFVLDNRMNLYMTK